MLRCGILLFWVIGGCFGAQSAVASADCNPKLLSQLRDDIAALTAGVTYEQASWLTKLAGRFTGRKWITEFRAFTTAERARIERVLESLDQTFSLQHQISSRSLATLIALQLEARHISFAWIEEPPKSGDDPGSIRLEIAPITAGANRPRPAELNQFAATLAQDGVTLAFDMRLIAQNFRASFEDRVGQKPVFNLPLESLLLPLSHSASIQHELVHLHFWLKLRGDTLVVEDSALFGVGGLDHFVEGMDAASEIAAKTRFLRRTTFQEAMAYRAGARGWELLGNEARLQRDLARSLIHYYWYAVASEVFPSYLHSKELRRDLQIMPLNKGAEQTPHLAMRIALPDRESLLLVVPLPTGFEPSYKEIVALFKEMEGKAVAGLRETVDAFRDRPELDPRYARLITETEALLLRLKD